MIIYKICRETDWEQACAAGIYDGSPDDKRDGFIHFSLKNQVDKTLEKHFTGQEGLILLAIDTACLKSEKLKYEASKTGEKYPHLYGSLCPSTVQSRHMIVKNEAGKNEVYF